MSNKRTSAAVCAFSIIELLVVIAIIALLVSILLPALANARRAGRQAVCMANLQQLGRAHHAYTSDFREFLATFNGRAEDTPAPIGHETPSFPTLADIGKQAVSILDKYVPDHGVKEFTPTKGLSIPTLPEQHSHFVLVSYLGDRLPTPGSACPEDQVRLRWHKDPLALPNSEEAKLLSIHNKANVGWLSFSSSYQLLPAGWLRDPPRLEWLVGGALFSQAGVHDLYNYSPNKHHRVEWLGRNRVFDIIAPASKVSVADSQQRHEKTPLYYAYPQTKQPLLFWDSSVSIRKTADANLGWNRKSHRDDGPAKFAYAPDLVFESRSFAQVANGPIFTASTVNGHYKWTRGGLKGVDFTGKEPSTKNW